MDLNEKIKFFINKGFFYESQSIYGSRSGFYDYGSLGTLLKRRFENLWRIYFGKLFDNIYEIQPSEIMHKNTFIASRHLELFNDPIVECKNGHRFRADKLIEEKLNIKAESLTIEEMNKIFDEERVVCPECGSKLSNVKLFNLMFPIYVGPVYDLFLILEELKRKYGFLVKNYRKINEKELNYIIKNYLKNKKLYSINLNNEKYIFDENKEIIIKIKDNEYYVYPENIEIKEEDINYLEILNNAEEIKDRF